MGDPDQRRGGWPSSDPDPPSHGEALSLSNEDLQGRQASRHRHRRSQGPLRSDGGPPLIALDVNVLIYAYRDEFEQHRQARAAVRELSEGPIPWADALQELLDNPRARLLTPGDRYWDMLRETITGAGASGNLIHDAEIVAVCMEHGVTTILTEDLDFRRFPGISVRRLEG